MLYVGVFSLGVSTSSGTGLPVVGLEAPDVVQGGAVNEAGAVAVPAGTRGGTGPLFSYVNDWYDNIHFAPAPVDFGLIVGEQARTVQLWNAYRVSVDITAKAFASGAGLADSLVIPTTLGPLRAVDFDITALADGPFALNDRFTIDTTAPLHPTASVAIVGLRTTVFPEPPNWRQAVSDTFTFSTDVIVAQRQREQRRSLDVEPRWTRRQLVRSTPDVVRTLATWQDSVIIMPDDVRKTRLVAPVSTGDATITLESDEPWAVNGNIIVIGDEIGVIAANNGTTYELHQPLGKDHPAGAVVHMGIPGRFSGNLTATWRADTYGELDAVFYAEPGYVYYPAPAWADVFDGRDILALRPNWREDVTQSWRSNDPLVNFGYGRWTLVPLSGINTRVMSAVWTRAKRSLVFELESFFRKQRGMAGEFWAPSHTNDFPQALPVLDGTYLLQFEDSAIYRDYQNDPVHRAVVIREPDGTPHYHKISGWATTPDGRSVATLVNPIVGSWTPAAVEWLYLCRFASDSLSITWLTDEVADVKISYQTLRVD